MKIAIPAIIAIGATVAIAQVKPKPAPVVYGKDNPIPACTKQLEDRVEAVTDSRYDFGAPDPYYPGGTFHVRVRCGLVYSVWVWKIYARGN